MAAEHRFLALDLGAESGRGILVTLREGKLGMEEIHRFANRRVRIGGTLYWDFPALYGEVINAIGICAERKVRPAGISIDTWGVDFGLLDRTGSLLSNPVMYRDARTEGIHEKAARIMPIEEIFAATALHAMPINTLFQLHAMQLAGSPLLDAAETFLMMPDLISYFLTGVRACELAIAQTSQLVDTQCHWCREILQRFDLPERIFPELVGPAKVLGPLEASVAAETGMGQVPVIASAGHDTGAAVGAVPGEGENWAFNSCGTWSILGRLVDSPVASKACYEAGFTNEITYGPAWYLARNVLGLWLVQELRRKWDRPDDPWDYNRMTAEAGAAAPGLLANVDDGSLLAPADMEAALLGLIRGSGQAAPEGRGQLVRCVLESLALQYAWCIDVIEELTGTRPGSMYMVGGGIANKLLCQFTADACAMPVHAGVDQCTALGNALGQAMALGIIESPQQARQVMRDSFEVITYEPQDADRWAENRARYKVLHSSKFV